MSNRHKLYVCALGVLFASGAWAGGHEGHEGREGRDDFAISERPVIDLDDIDVSDAKPVQRKEETAQTGEGKVHVPANKVDFGIYNDSVREILNLVAQTDKALAVLDLKIEAYELKKLALETEGRTSNNLERAIKDTKEIRDRLKVARNRIQEKLTQFAIEYNFKKLGETGKYVQGGACVGNCYCTEAGCFCESTCCVNAKDCGVVPGSGKDRAGTYGAVRA